jgi:pimeloyl-ACP methyl ester carboxylesterase
VSLARLVVVIVLLVPAAAVSTLAHLAAQARAQELDGAWHGGLRNESDWCFARATLKEDGDRLTGTIDVPALDVRGAKLSGERDGSLWRWRFPAPEREELLFEGVLADNAFASRDSASWDGSAFRFVRTGNAEWIQEDVLGSYAQDAQAPLWMIAGSEGGLRCFLPDHASATLLPVGPDRFEVTCWDLLPDFRGDARFVRGADGRVAALHLRIDQEPEERVFARLERAPHELVTTKFADGKLSGLLLAPSDGKRHRAVVFIQGTGYSTLDRNYEMRWARAYLAQGNAVFLFDKRGCGRSQGDWHTATLDELAEDVRAAVRWLRTREEVDAAAIGVHGISEGGWIAASVGTRADEVAFVINQGGPAVSPLEDELDDLTAGIGEAGFQGEDLAIANELARAWVGLYRSHQGLADFDKALQAARKRPWFEAFRAKIPESEDDPRVQWWRKRGAFDSPAAWRAVAVPALVVIGSRDDTMALGKNLELFEAAAQGQSAHRAALDRRGRPWAAHRQ